MTGDLNAWRTYRHSVTGLVGVFPARLGDNDPHLTEVKEGAKRLAYKPIPHEAVVAYLESREEASEDAAPVIEADEALAKTPVKTTTSGGRRSSTKRKRK